MTGHFWTNSVQLLFYIDIWQTIQKFCIHHVKTEFSITFTCQKRFSSHCIIRTKITWPYFSYLPLGNDIRTTATTVDYISGIMPNAIKKRTGLIGNFSRSAFELRAWLHATTIIGAETDVSCNKAERYGACVLAFSRENERGARRSNRSSRSLSPGDQRSRRKTEDLFKKISHILEITHKFHEKLSFSVQSVFWKTKHLFVT